MNDRVEDARRQLTQLQQQRRRSRGGGGNKRRQAELQDALARSGCGGQAARAAARGGGLFDFFGGGQERKSSSSRRPRSIAASTRTAAIVRSAFGSATASSIPIHYSHLWQPAGQDAQQCQSNCAAPAELYVYRNPGQEIEQAISLNGSAYMDLPVALKYRKEYVKGCSCKQAEYNPTEIEAPTSTPKPTPPAKPAKGKAAKAPRNRACAGAGRRYTGPTGASAARSRRDRQQPAGGRRAPPPQAAVPAGTEAAGRRAAARACAARASARAVSAAAAAARRNRPARQVRPASRPPPPAAVTPYASCLRAAPARARPINGNSCLSSGPCSRPVSASRKAGTAPCPWRRSPA